MVKVTKQNGGRGRNERKQEQAKETFREGHKPCMSLRACMTHDPLLLDTCGWIIQKVI